MRYSCDRDAGGSAATSPWPVGACAPRGLSLYPNA